MHGLCTAVNMKFIVNIDDVFIGGVGADMQSLLISI